MNNLQLKILQSLMVKRKGRGMTWQHVSTSRTAFIPRKVIFVNILTCVKKCNQSVLRHNRISYVSLYVSYTTLHQQLTTDGDI